MASVALNMSSGPVTSYGNVALAGSGKQGILKKLDNNYHEIILGAFGAFGNGDWLYDTASAMKYMENDPDFLAMLQGGRLKSEWGHPDRLPGMSDRDWFIRICEIKEKNVSSQIRRIRPSLDTVVDERGRKVVALIGEVTGSGPFSSEFNRSLENPDEDVNYSIRCFAKKNFNNMTKFMTKIITWDSVTDPGIAVASKYKTPSLESKSHVARMLDSAEFNLEHLRGQLHEVPANDVSFESSGNAIKIFNSLYVETKKQFAMPKTLAW